MGIAPSKLLAALRRTIRKMVRRAVIRVVNDSLKQQGLQLQILAGNVADDVENFQQVGFTSVPEDGAEAIVLAVGGNRGHLVVIATGDRRYRKKDMGPGAAAMHYREICHVHCKVDGSVEILAPGGVTVTGNVAVSGNVADGTGAMQAMRDTFNAHVHPEQNGAGGPNTLVPTTQMT